MPKYSDTSSMHDQSLMVKENLLKFKIISRPRSTHFLSHRNGESRKAEIKRSRGYSKSSWSFHIGSSMENPFNKSHRSSRVSC
jgi:hypothetical protein